MSSYYYLYLAYQAQLFNAMIGLFVLGIAMALGWWALMLILDNHPRARTWAGWSYTACCMAFYLVVAVVFA